MKLGTVGALKMAITGFWYNGEFANYLPKYYDAAGPNMTTFEEWGHFSQLLWKDSIEVGCVSQFCEFGTIYSGMQSWYTVCNYGPAGTFNFTTIITQLLISNRQHGWWLSGQCTQASGQEHPGSISRLLTKLVLLLVLC